MDYKVIYKKVKHGYVRINNDGKLTLTIPNRLKNNEWFKNILLKKWEILLKKMEKKSVLQDVEWDYIFLFGEKIPKNKIITKKTKNEKIFLSKYFKKILYDYSVPILDEMSGKLSKKYTELKIKKLISKRGSCSYDQKIILNQNLVHLPNKYIKYVIVHEACHLVQKNHSSKFRKLVEQYSPEYKQLRKEMKDIILR